MSKTFTYTKVTGHYYCQYSDDWEQDGVDFTYNVSDEKLLHKIVELIFEDYFGENDFIKQNKSQHKAIKENLKKMVQDNDLINHFVECYEETLKESFEEEAIEWYNS
jgi:hypothetical protein